ncbi:hypothetical protein MBLNU457_4286t1 [Dothideomycetes sp. NU457]
MSGIYGHLARRGLEVVSAHVSNPQDERIEALKTQAQVYEQHGEDVSPWEIFAIFFLVIIFIASYASVKYTLGEVMASLVMIEEPKTLVVSDTKPIDNEDPDAPLEKAPLMDEEISVYKQELVTTNIKRTALLLRSVGGRFSRWRGAQIALVYHVAHALVNNGSIHLLSNFMEVPMAFLLSSIISTLCLSRLHMVWTHAMISKPSTVHWTKRVNPEKKAFKALALPSIVYACAQNLVVMVPACVFFLWGIFPSNMAEVDEQNEALRVLATLATAVFIGLAVLLPASVTLTRVEAALLPEDMETIVNFDRTLNGTSTFAITETDINARALFNGAWRSFDRPARLRLIKFYAKFLMVQIVVIATGIFWVSTLISVIGVDKLAAFTQAGSAQLQLMSMGQPI